MMKICCLILSILLVSCAAVQQTIIVPSEINDYCTRISDGGNNSVTMRTCIRQERLAKSRINEMSVPPHIAIYCRKMADSTGGSYQVMLTCVEKELSEQ